MMKKRMSAGFGVALAAVMALLVTSPALAHDQIIGSTPEVNQVVTEVPENITLTFSADLLVLGEVSSTTTVLVIDDSGANWASGEIAVAGSMVTAGVKPEMKSGNYEVRWQVVSSDGHPITGVVPFVLKLAGEVAPEPATPTPTPEATLATPEPAEDLPQNDGEMVITQAPEGQADLGRIIFIGVIGGVVALGLVVLVTWLVRRGSAARSAKSEQESSNGGDA